MKPGADLDEALARRHRLKIATALVALAIIAVLWLFAKMG